MIGLRALAVLLAGAQLLSGCIAAGAVLPLAASGMLINTELNRREQRRLYEGRVMAQSAPALAPSAPGSAPPAQSDLERTASEVLASPADLPLIAAEQGSQAEHFLYRSGEAAALSLQAYQSLWHYLLERNTDRILKRPIASVVLTPGSTLAAPRFTSCDEKPLAAVFDIDETLVLNPEPGAKVEAADGPVSAPGAVEAIEAIRRSGVEVLFNSERSVSEASEVAARLQVAGFGLAEPGKTLWLRGDTGLGKDLGRAEIATRYCVVALVGDQLSDFSDLFDAPGLTPLVRRNMASQTMIAPLWGSGWFILPNPMQSSGTTSQDKRRTPPAEEQN